jgi:asparagine synthase (glutamine-hydrolysing)
MRDTMIHRGPDDAGLWWSQDHRVGLGHRRLAIIDLSSAGHQPMANASKVNWLVFNGEIYNYQALRHELEAQGHRFCTASDTEVILEAYQAWGVDCVTHLEGMFAFCLYDDTAKHLFLARDRAGEKPLFYYSRPGKFMFASELKALMADSTLLREIELNALNFYLAYGYVPREFCMLKGVQKMTQGQAMTYNLETDVLRTWHYWQLPESSRQGTVSKEDLVDELEYLLADSVRYRLVADVPVGILLSGGIDSSLVTALAARVSSKPVKTFTISFPGYGRYNEGPYAQVVAQHFGTDHTELVAEPATIDLLPELARQYDEPLGDSSIVPTYLVTRLVRQHATVALGGDGGDELFGGYPHYRRLQRMDQIRHFVPPIVRSWIGKTASMTLPIGVRGRNYLIGFADEKSHSIAYMNLLFDARRRFDLLSPEVREAIQCYQPPESHKASLCNGFDSTLQQSTTVDFKTYLVDDILVKVDRASMLNSLEVRAPWLSHPLIEFAFGHVPDRFKVNKHVSKILPRLLAQRLLPAHLNLNRKQGFTPPLGEWFKEGWGEYFEAILSKADPLLFDQRMIKSLIAGQCQGYNNTRQLFALTMFELWRQHYKVGL